MNTKGLLVALVLIVAGIFAYSYFRTKSNDTIPTDTLSDVTATDRTPYNNTIYRVAFSYPNTMSVASEESIKSFGWNSQESAGSRIVAVVLPRSYASSTNFSDATVAVGINPALKSKLQCEKYTEGSSSRSVVTMGGATWHKESMSDAGAGNYYDSVIYKTLRPEGCIALETIVHSTNIDNYSPDQGITQFNRHDIDNVINSVVSSFRFTDSVATVPATPAQKQCYIGGCSGQICSDTSGVASTCEYKEEYACYKKSKCEVQPTGECGWTQTVEMMLCLGINDK